MRLFRIGALALATSLAAGCAGSTTPTPPVPPGPPTTTLTLKAQQQAAQASLAVEQGILFWADTFGPLQSGSLRSNAAPPCKDGVQQSITHPAPGQTTVTVDVFFEPACVTLWQHVVVNVDQPVPQRIAASGTETIYTPKGRVTGYNTFDATQTQIGKGTQLEARGTLAPAKGAQPDGAFGLSCTSTSSDNCGYGTILNVPGAPVQIGSAFSSTGTRTSTALSGKVTVKGYAGARNTLTLVKGSGNEWNIAGGTPLADASGTYDGSFDDLGLVSALHLVLNDKVADAASDLQYANDANVGAISQISNLAAAASYQTDDGGNGSITYSTGAKRKITGFFVNR